MFRLHIRGKNGKNQKVSCFTVFTGGGAPFSLPWGAPFSSTISAVKTVKIDCFVVYFFSCGVAKGYP